MPLVTSTEMFKKAYNGGYAIGAFNVNNMEIIQGTHRSFFRSAQAQGNMPTTHIS